MDLGGDGRGEAAREPLPHTTSQKQHEEKGAAIEADESGTTMSLASILRSTLAPPLTSWTNLVVQRAAVGASLNQIRSVWQEVIRQVPSDDPNKLGKLTFEDPDLADTRMVRAIRAEGER